MNTTIDFLEAVKAKRGVTSDYALAPILGVTRSAVSQWRNKNTYLDNSTAIRVARILEIEPDTVLAAVQSERAKTEDEKTAWKLIYERLGGIAASVLVATLLSSPNPAHARFAGASLPNNVYYVKSRRRLNPNPFLQILQPFLQAL